MDLDSYNHFRHFDRKKIEHLISDNYEPTNQYLDTIIHDMNWRYFEVNLEYYMNSDIPIVRIIIHVIKHPFNIYVLSGYNRYDWRYTNFRHEFMEYIRYVLNNTKCVIIKSGIKFLLWKNSINLNVFSIQEVYKLYKIYKSTIYVPGCYPYFPTDEYKLNKFETLYKYYGPLILLQKTNKHSFMNVIRKSSIYDINIIRIIKKFLS